MTKEEYQIYLQSNHWKVLRRQRLELDQYKCKCESTFFLNVHHKVYRKNLYDTQLDDLVTLCNYCHKKAHGLNKPSDRPIYTKKQKQEIARKNAPPRTGGMTRKQRAKYNREQRKLEKRHRNERKRNKKKRNKSDQNIKHPSPPSSLDGKTNQQLIEEQKAWSNDRRSLHY